MEVQFKDRIKACFHRDACSLQVSNPKYCLKIIGIVTGVIFLAFLMWFIIDMSIQLTVGWGFYIYCQLPCVLSAIFFAVSFRFYQLQRHKEKYPEVYETAEDYKNSHYEIGGEIDEPEVKYQYEVEVAITEFRSLLFGMNGWFCFFEWSVLLFCVLVN